LLKSSTALSLYRSPLNRFGIIGECLNSHATAAAGSTITGGSVLPAAPSLKSSTAQQLNGLIALQLYRSIALSLYRSLFLPIAHAT
jgi:hypothetical protein